MTLDLWGYVPFLRLCCVRAQIQNEKCFKFPFRKQSRNWQSHPALKIAFHLALKLRIFNFYINLINVLSFFLLFILSALKQNGLRRDCSSFQIRFHRSSKNFGENFSLSANEKWKTKWMLEMRFGFKVFQCFEATVKAHERSNKLLSLWWLATMSMITGKFITEPFPSPLFMFTHLCCH